MDLVQLMANAMASAFGMGIANELYHAFAEYRKALKQRLLEDTLYAINYYRRSKDIERSLHVIREAKTPGEPVTATPVVPLPVHYSPPWMQPAEPEPVLPSNTPDPNILRRVAADVPKPETYVPMTYCIPEKPKDASTDLLAAKMNEWEGT